MNKKKLTIDDLNTALEVTTRKNWITLLGIVVFMTFWVLWITFGSIGIYTGGKGVLISKEGLFSINSNGGGSIRKIYVEPGDKVKSGDIIVELSHLKNDIELQLQMAEVENLEKMLRDIQEKETLSSSQWSPRRDKIERELWRAKEKSTLLLALQEARRIRSPRDGKVLKILSEEGSMVKPGSPIVLLEGSVDDEPEYLVYGYIPVEKGKSIIPGTRVLVSPSTVNIKEKGPLIGTVKEVAQLASSEEQISNKFYSSGIVNYLMGKSKSVIELVIELEKDSAALYTSSSYHSPGSGKGSEAKLSTGTLCEINMVIKTTRPINYVFPLWNLNEN